MNLQMIRKLCGIVFTMTLFSGFLSQQVLAAEESRPGTFAEGSKTWVENCARCHNIRSPSDLRDDQWVTSVFHMRIRAGLTGQETRDVLAFLQGANTNVRTVSDIAELPVSSESQTATTGQEIYENNCLACHGADGTGNLPGMPDFTESQGSLSKSDTVLLDNIINGFQSPNGLMPMPAKGGNSALTDTDMSTVLDYIRNSFDQ